jgi:hypothetical protein
MGETLYVTLTKEDSPVQEEYWWPLVFEAMHRAAFQFVDPRSKTKQGTYFSFAVEMDYVVCTFQELWNALYAKRDTILVLFWSSNQRGEPFDVGVNVRKEMNQTNGHWQLELSLEDGYLGNDDVELDRIRVSALFQVSLALYELCFPCSIKIFWSEDETNLTQMRAAKQEEQLEPMVFYGQTLHWKKLASYVGQDLFIVDPLPIHLWGNKFRFISLPSTMSYGE